MKATNYTKAGKMVQVIKAQRVYEAADIDENFTIDGVRVVDIDRDDETCIIYLENGEVIRAGSWELIDRASEVVGA